MDNATERRRLFTRIGLYGFLTSLGLSCFGCLRFLFPRAFYEPQTRFKVGRPSDFPKGSVRFLPKRRVYVYRDAEGFFVVSAVCTHLGCIASRTENGFSCPCHGSHFDAQGYVLSGPAPGRLPWFEISYSPDGYLVVDANRIVAVGTKLSYA